MPTSSPTHVLLVRAVNLGASNRLPMAEFRDGLAQLGCHDVRTYLQSGNAVVACDLESHTLSAQVEEVLRERWNLTVPVIVRTREEFLRIHALDPLRHLSSDDKLYSVVYFTEPVEQLLAAAVETSGKGPDAWGAETWLADGRELYLWQPGSIHSSPLGAWVKKVTQASPGTARNWRTVDAVAQMLRS